jgi:hypothetical protein
MPYETDDIPAIYEGSLEDAALHMPYAEDEPRPPQPPHVWVGKPHSYSVTRQGGFDVVSLDGSQTYGQLVVGETADRRRVYSRLVRGTTVFEPETRNPLGGQGAYRDAPPSNAELTAAIDAARTAVARAENGLGRPRELENPDRLELRIPSALLTRVDTARGAISRSGWIREAIERRLESGD